MATQGYDANSEFQVTSPSTATHEKKSVAEKVKGLLGGHGHKVDSTGVHQPGGVYGDATPTAGNMDSTRVGCLDKFKAKAGVGHGLAPEQARAHHAVDPSTSPDFNGGTNVNSSAAVHGGWPYPTNPRQNLNQAPMAGGYGVHNQNEAPGMAGYGDQSLNQTPGTAGYGHQNLNQTAGAAGFGHQNLNQTPGTGGYGDQNLNQTAGAGDFGVQHPNQASAGGYGDQNLNQTPGAGGFGVQHPNQASAGGYGGQNPTGDYGVQDVNHASAAGGYGVGNPNQAPASGLYGTGNSNQAPSGGYGMGNNDPASTASNYGDSQPTNPTGMTNAQGGAVLGDHHGNVHQGPRDDTVKKEGFVSKIMDKLHSPKNKPAHDSTTSTPTPY